MKSARRRLDDPAHPAAAQFERVSGHKIVIRYDSAPELIKMAAGGVPFDLGVVPQVVWKDAAARAQIVPGSTPNVARVGIPRRTFCSSILDWRSAPILDLSCGQRGGLISLPLRCGPSINIYGQNPALSASRWARLPKAPSANQRPTLSRAAGNSSG
jgi:hypothetical protein